MRENTGQKNFTQCNRKILANSATIFLMLLQSAFCKKNVYLHDGICQPNYANDSYTCLCVGRYSGMYCEENEGFSLLQFSLGVIYLARTKIFQILTFLT